VHAGAQRGLVHLLPAGARILRIHQPVLGAQLVALRAPIALLTEARVCAPRRALARGHSTETLNGRSCRSPGVPGRTACTLLWGNTRACSPSRVYAARPAARAGTPKDALLSSSVWQCCLRGQFNTHGALQGSAPAWAGRGGAQERRQQAKEGAPPCQSSSRPYWACRVQPSVKPCLHSMCSIHTPEQNMPALWHTRRTSSQALERQGPILRRMLQCAPQHTKVVCPARALQRQDGHAPAAPQYHVGQNIQCLAAPWCQQSSMQSIIIRCTLHHDNQSGTVSETPVVYTAAMHAGLLH